MTLSSPLATSSEYVAIVLTPYGTFSLSSPSLWSRVSSALNAMSVIATAVTFSLLIFLSRSFKFSNKRVQETCRLQDLCLETLGVEDSALLFVLLVTCKCEPRALLVKELELFFCVTK
ncbi:hypothetical protein CsSME_00006326 [Camellia sinensis var. sinensis]